MSALLGHKIYKTDKLMKNEINENQSLTKAPTSSAGLSKI
jgi:hypothetical protein